MDRILRNTSFMRNLISMFIDEAHCISHWGADFRKKYSTLGRVRPFFPRGTPVIAVTATLTARVRRTIHSTLLFSQSASRSRFVNKGNDRPNVSIIVRAAEHPLSSYADLAFVIPQSVHKITDIPKTYIYVDDIAAGTEMIDYLDDLLQKAASPELRASLGSDSASTLRGVLRPFNANLSPEYRTEAMSQFRAGSIRIMICTDAAGMVSIAY